MPRADGRVVLLLLGLVLGLAFQGTRGLFETTEGRYAEAGREMLETGAWLEPQLDYQPHWTKPPATYWTVAGGLALLGDNAWGARFANAILFALTGLAVAGIGRLLWDARTGFIAGLVFLTSLFPFAAAAVLSTDTLLALTETLFLLGYVKAWRSEGRSRRWAIHGMWLALGASFLVKGPPGLLLLLPVLVFHWRAGRPFRMTEPGAILAGAVFGLWWYLLEVATHPGLLSYLVGEEVVARNLTDTFGRNPQWWAPFVIYLPVLLLAPGIWLVDAVRTFRESGSWGWRSIASALTERGSSRSLLLYVVVLPLVVLSLSRSRLPLYVLPLYPALALALARGVARYRIDPLHHARRYAAAGAVLLIVAKGIASIIPSNSDMSALAAAVRSESGDAADVAAYGEAKLFGLQFYLNGALTRVPRDGVEGGEKGLRRLLTTLPDGEPLVIVARGRNRSTVADAIGTSGVIARSADEGGWRLWVVSFP